MADQGVTAKTAGTFSNNLAYGGIDYFSDVDWFEFTAASDTYYRILIEGLDGGGLSALTGAELRLVDKKGVDLNSDSDPDNDYIPDTTSGGELDALIFINNEAKAGKYYVQVSGGTGLTGHYRLTLDPISDDYGQTSKTAGTLGSSDQSGRIDWGADIDWLKLDVAADTYYDISLDSSDLTDGTLRLLDKSGKDVTAEVAL
ncbi:pre-peptidase C-terminal domain-containing protein, partial [Thiorhodococcus fuscus]